MEPYDECSVLLPTATLEDFPVGGSETDARSLLAGWTVLWHPVLLDQTKQNPTWYRADSPPTPDGPRVIVVPDPSLKQLPADYRRKCDANPQCRWISGGDRSEMLRGLELDTAHPEPLQHGSRTLAVDDFFAVGYLSLQIQIMTRRLRYTSNLDELYLQAKVVEAATAFCGRDAKAAAEALHDAFDCLSEERDHYFSSDPHLVDLTLLTPEVLEESLQTGWLDTLEREATADQPAENVWGTPRNVLVDSRVAEAMLRRKVGADSGGDLDAGMESFRQTLKRDTVGWAGGGAVLNAQLPHPDEPDDEDTPGDAADRPLMCLDAMTMSAARAAFIAGTRLAEQAIGTPPSVFGQFSGLTPVDLVSNLATLGYRGVIPIDFSRGTGYGDESKVILAAGGHELEALTAKPIDAGSDVAFQSLGARLGEAIDSGEVATGLLVHWPGRVCDSFRDLCRTATWSVALGKFWTLQRYFTDGERPYHHGSLEAVSKESADQVLAAIAASPSRLTLASLAASFRDTVRAETDRLIQSIAVLAKPALLERLAGDDPGRAENDTSPERLIAEAIGVDWLADGTPAADESAVQLLCFNPHGAGQRVQAVVAGGAPEDESFIYAISAAPQGGAAVTFDVPATGFTKLTPTRSVPKTGWLKRLTGGTKQIAEDSMLRNEFMAVTLGEANGGIAGVYSASRGNRFSMRLVAAKDLAGDDEGGEMICQRMHRVQSDETHGVVETSGILRDGEDQTLAEFTLRYELPRGSRSLQVTGTIKPLAAAAKDAAADLWKRYFAVRTAVADEAAIMRPLVRDKVHSTSGRKLVAPLGVLIDEAEKQTLVSGHGLPVHRKVGDRFLDTLVGFAGPSTSGEDATIEFHMTFAFDCRTPVAFARAMLAPVQPLRVASHGPSTGPTEQAWLVHCSAAEALISDLVVARRRDGKLAARMQLVQTRPKTSRVKLQFCAFAHAAFLADASGIERPLDELPEDVRCNDGTVELSLGGHEAVDLVVVFDI
jgi:alpha-mannosidase